MGAAARGRSAAAIRSASSAPTPVCAHQIVSINAKMQSMLPETWVTVTAHGYVTGTKSKFASRGETERHQRLGRHGEVTETCRVVPDWLAAPKCGTDHQQFCQKRLGADGAPAR